MWKKWKITLSIGLQTIFLQYSPLTNILILYGRYKECSIIEISPFPFSDLRIKTEPRGSSAGPGSSGGGGANDSSSSSSLHNSRSEPAPSHDSNHHGSSEDSWRDRDSNPLNPKQTEHNPGREERGGTVWNSTTQPPPFQTNQEISNAHKSAIATTTPTGK